MRATWVGLVVAASNAAASEVARDYPSRRIGLWEVRSVGVQASGLEATKFCVGPQTDTPAHHLDRNVGRRGSCDFGAFERAGQSWLAESVCREGRTTVTSRSVASGDFLHRYRIDTVVQYDPPLAGVRREDKDALEARWLGPCAAGQKPGDVVVPGMGTLNMVDGRFHAEPEAQPETKSPRKPSTRPRADTRAPH